MSELHKNENALKDYPMIVRYLDVQDFGPCDDGPTAVCPHCGSDGRYVHHFQVEDGRVLGAMSGCLKLFPMSEIARTEMKLRERERDLKKRFGPEAKLNSWQSKQSLAINEFYAGERSYDDTLATIKREQAAMASFRRNKGGR